MIISKKYNFIFFKTFKCQTENFISKISFFLDKNDFVSITSYELNKLRNSEIDRYGHKFFSNKINVSLDYQKIISNFIKNLILFRKFNHIVEYKPKILQHDSIKNIKKIIKPKVFNNFEKFFFFREFEDVIISLYKDKEYKKILKKKNIKNFDSFFERECEFWFYRYMATFSLENKLYCDFILPFNNLKKSYDFLIKKYNLSCERDYFIKSKVNEGFKEKIYLKSSHKQKINKLKSNSVLNQSEFYKKII